MPIKNLKNHFNDIIVTLGMLFIYTLLAANFFPTGVTSILFSFLWKFILVLMIFSFLILIFIFSFTKEKNFFYLKKIDHFEFRDLILLLFPMTPIFQYIIFNHDILSISDSVVIISFFVFLILIFAFTVPWFLSVIASKRILMMFSLSLLFITFNMPYLATIISYHQNILNMQLLILVIILSFFIANIFIPKKIIATVIGAYFLVNTITSVLSANIFEISMQHHENLPIISAVDNRELINDNDIFLLVYESYSNYETMKNYGFDNSAKLSFLEKNNFHIYHGVYSLGTPTLSSMSYVFNVDREQPFHRKYLAGGGAVQKIVSKKGYQTFAVGLSDYFFRGLSIDEIEYDFIFPALTGGASLLIDAILKGDFSEIVSLERVDFASYLKQKHKVLKGKHQSPVFLYAHSIYPGHRPWQSQYADDENKYIKIHLNHIKIANIEIRKDVDKILKYNPSAIIIIAGDHGPFLTKTGYGVHANPHEYSINDIDRYDMQDRYGAFLAIRWPNEDYSTKHDIAILQDIFPAVFAYLFDDDTLFDKFRIKLRITVNPHMTRGVYVKDGIISGGKDDGKPLFEGVE